MSADRLRVHLTRLENVAMQQGGSRTAWTGYNASVDYVKRELQDNTNLILSTTSFSFTAFEDPGTSSLSQVAPSSVTFVRNSDFLVASGSGQGGLVAAQTVYVGTACSAFADLPPNSIALIARGDCEFVDKIALAISKKAAGVIVYNNVAGEGPVYFAATRNGEQAAVPVLSITYSVGVLLQLGKATVSMAAGSVVEKQVATMNLCAETPYGNPESVIVVGAHLDGVEAGAGINDNGSGSVAVLELAVAFGKALPNSKSKVRFCWWGAEEEGLLGSAHYVNTLTPQQKSVIKTYLNFDMIGSRNYISFIFNGLSAADPTVRNASTTLTQLFINQFNAAAKPFALEDFASSLSAANTDYGPFLFAGIPSGGMSTGASEQKTIAERTAFGGFANAPADSCYHRSCDTVDNIEFTALQSMAKYAAGVLAELATQSDLPAFLQNGGSVAASGAGAVEAQERQSCLASNVEEELVCTAHKRGPRLPRWANKQ